MRGKLFFLLIGKTGQGKSATGNSLLSKKAFETSAGTKSKTKTVNDDYAKFEGYILKVIDGPGLEDTDMDTVKDREAAVKNMDIALGMCSEGINAFLYVMKFPSRFTKEDRATMDSLKHIFGETYFNYVIVVYTGGDQFLETMEYDNCNLSFEEWCREQTSGMKELYELCNGRFVLFSNREKNEEKNKEQIRQIIRLTESLQTVHGRYTSACFEQAQKEREKLILEHKAPHLREEFQEKIALLTADLELYRGQPSDDLKKEIEHKIHALIADIDNHDKGHGVLDDVKMLVVQIRENLHDTVKLQRLTEELNALRKGKALWTFLGSVCTVVGGVIAVVVPGIGTAAVAAVGAAATGVSTVVNWFVKGNKEGKIEEEINEIKNKIHKI